MITEALPNRFACILCQKERLPARSGTEEGIAMNTFRNLAKVCKVGIFMLLA